MRPESAVVHDATSTVLRSCRATEAFACLTGSSAWGSSRPGSDIDVVVVLPDGLDLPVAWSVREAFTRAYVDLHVLHGRTPDLDWPGEVLFAGDLETAIVWADSSSGSGDGRDDTDPHRVWLTMVATGVPLTHGSVFAHAADRSAAALSPLLHPADAVGDNTGPRRVDVASWGLRPSVLRRCPRLCGSRVSRPTSSSAIPAARCRDHPPLLELSVARWRGVARDRWEERVG